MSGPSTGAGQKAVYIKTSSITTLSDTDLLDGAQKATVSRKLDTAEVSAQGDSVKRFVAGCQEYSISVEGTFNRGSTVGEIVRTAWVNKSKVYVAIIEYPDVAPLGIMGQCYPCYVAEDPFDFDVNGLSMRKISFVLAAVPTNVAQPSP